MEDSRIESGLSVAREAIANKDPDLLKRCVETFRRHGVPVERYRALIEACPLALVAEARLAIVIASSHRGVLTLGQDIPWEDVAAMLSDSRGRRSLYAEETAMDSLFSSGRSSGDNAQVPDVSAG